MKKQFFVAAMAVALGAGLTACSSDNLDPKYPTTVGQKASTYMTVAFSLPSSVQGTRADDGQNKPQPDFNNKGTWNGQDKIEKVAVYVFKATGAAAAGTDALETTKTYLGSELGFNQKDASGKTYANAQKAFKVTPGLKTVYVVVNPTAAATTLLASASNLNDFKVAYESSNLSLTNPTRLTTDMVGDMTRADEVSPVEGKGTASAKDKIIMTGESTVLTLEDNISEQQAVSGQKNRASLEVQRVSARVLVTTATGKTEFEVKGVDPANPADQNFVAAKVTKLTYVVAQGEANLYFKQKASGNADLSFLTPAWDKVNAGGEYWSYEQMRDYATIGKFYDYSGLWKNTAAYTGYKGIAVPSRVAYEAANKAAELGHVTDEMAKNLNTEFVLPTLHKFDSDRATTGYRKGNTAYILVRGLLTPQKFLKADGSVSTNTAEIEGKDFYLGANGVFYASATNIQDPAKGGVANQTAQKFEKGKVLYFVWLNPDDIIKAVNSPVIRNNVYHVQISGISKIGANWNPLVPFPDPSIPSGPGTVDPNQPGGPTNPNNPDPRPDNPLEPVTPPVDPKDPLTFKETWMSVQVNILPWQVHSYQVELTI